ncbi:MAG: hypothetical protein U1C04_21790, partial [Hydrogenophaga sp.]|uniref:hypothetical protein n=1 Tax=Hydrogenophaga sp. TaxID=1904254 RepID=UPI002ABA3F04
FGQGFEGALREHVVDFKFCGVLASLGIAMTAIGGGVVLVFSGWSGHRSAGNPMSLQARE